MQETTLFETLGNAELLTQNRVAVFSSQSVPKKIEPDATRLFHELTNLPVAIAGGWQAPLENKLFRAEARLNAKANFIHYLAKDINTFQPNELQQKLLDAGKLLIIAPGLNQTRPTKKQVNQRDNLLFSQINKILFLYISKGGRLENYLNTLSGHNYQIFILDHPANQNCFPDDVVRINTDNAALILPT